MGEKGNGIKKVIPTYLTYYSKQADSATQQPDMLLLLLLFYCRELLIRPRDRYL